MPWFILEKDVANNVLIAGQGRNHPKLIHSHLEVEDFSWIDGSAPHRVFDGEVQIRHLGEAIAARIECQDDGRVVMTMASPHWAAAIGQSAVVYQGDVCLGGGEIAVAR